MLEHLLSMGANIVAVGTKKNSPKIDSANLAEICIRFKIPYFYIKNSNSVETENMIKACNPDVIFCFGWSYILKKNILDIAPKGVIGFHPTELPRNRGRHPLIWTIDLGLTQTANTFFKMDEGADSGDIVDQLCYEVSYDDCARSLYQKMEEVAKKQISRFLPLMESGGLKYIPQDHNKSNFWRQRRPEDGRIDFRMSRRSIYNLVRAISKPCIGAHLLYKNHAVKIWKVSEVELNEPLIEPGRIISVEDHIIRVKCHDGAVDICDHEFSAMPEVGEYL